MDAKQPSPLFRVISVFCGLIAAALIASLLWGHHAAAFFSRLALDLGDWMPSDVPMSYGWFRPSFVEFPLPRRDIGGLIWFGLAAASLMFAFVVIGGLLSRLIARAGVRPPEARRAFIVESMAPVAWFAIAAFVWRFYSALTLDRPIAGDEPVHIDHGVGAIAAMWIGGWLGMTCSTRVAYVRRALVLVRRRGLCRRCGYDLESGSSTSCPECGAARSSAAGVGSVVRGSVLVFAFVFAFALLAAPYAWPHVMAMIPHDVHASLARLFQ